MLIILLIANTLFADMKRNAAVIISKNNFLIIVMFLIVNLLFLFIFSVETLVEHSVRLRVHYLISQSACQK